MSFTAKKSNHFARISLAFIVFNLPLNAVQNKQKTPNKQGRMHRGTTLLIKRFQIETLISFKADNGTIR